MTIKKIVTGLVLVFTGIFVYGKNGLENIVVEKFYISNKADSIGSIGALPVSSVTYRIYADMLPGYKLQMVFGNAKHPVTISTSTSFFNNEDRGSTAPNGISVTNMKKNSVMLDSWLSVGAAASGKTGVLKTDDTDGSVGNTNGILQNADPLAGIPVKTQDGMVTGTPESVTFVGFDPTGGVFDMTSQAGNSFTTNNGAWASLNGSVGANPDTNRVLIAQITTDGILHFELNIQIGTPSGGTEQYVAKNPVGNEILMPALIYNVPPTVSITSPANSAKYKTGDIVSITANAADVDGTVASVRFFVNNKQVGIDSIAPYQYDWTSIAGTDTLTAVATDNRGAKTTSAKVIIRVLNNIPPTVSITSPANASSFITGDAVAIKVNAIDSDGTVSLVEFYINGVLMGNDATAPYQYNWTSVAGTDTLTAVATDNKGAKTTSAKVIIKVHDNIPPTISITSPANGATFVSNALILIKTNAADTDGTVTLVEFFVNRVLIGSVTSFPYQYNWTTIAGKDTLMAVVTDNKGAKTTSAKVIVTVLNNFPPKISITSPANGAALVAGGIVAIKANATDTDGTVTLVEFFINHVLVGSSTTFPYQYNWTTVTGKDTLTAVATDNLGVKTISAKVIVTVNNNMPPTSAITSPAIGGAFIAGDLVDIQANASDADGTVAVVKFYVNRLLVGSDSTAPYQFSWKCFAGKDTITAVAIDNNGAKTTSAKVMITVKINIPPAVSITSPASGSTYNNSALIAIKAYATDADGSIDLVEFYVNGIPVGVDSLAPYQYNWTGVPGRDTLTAVATDDRGAKTASAKIIITVKNNVPPAINITSPATGAIFTAPLVISIKANATDLDGKVSRVDFYVNRVLVGSDTISPYHYNWACVAGMDTLTAVATDNSGAQTTSAKVILNVKNNLPPTVSIISPLNGTSFTLPALIPIKANAADADGVVALVEFFVNGQLVGNHATSPYQYDWTIVGGTGADTLTAVATDNKGATTTSAKVIINLRGVVTVNNPVPVGGVLNVFPDPAKDELILQIISSGRSTGTDNYEIYNSEGKLVLRKNLAITSASQEEKIDISSFAEGLYIIKLSVEGVTTGKRIIKN